MLPMSLDCPFLLGISGFSNDYLLSTKRYTESYWATQTPLNRLEGVELRCSGSVAMLSPPVSPVVLHDDDGLKVKTMSHMTLFESGDLIM